MMSELEHTWLAEYRRGDIEALGKLVEHTRRPLYGFIHKMIANKSDADEIFQETWIRAIKNLDTYRDKKFMSWLFRIARNLVIDRVRKAKRIVDLQCDNNEKSIEAQLPAPGLDPAHVAQGSDLGERIAQAIQDLPQEQREVFLLRMEGNIPFKEIASLQETSINTALARMQYALSKLRDVLQQDYQTLGTSL